MKKIKVVFFTQSPAVWPSTESVWRAFHKNKQCDTKIVQLPFIHDSFNDNDKIYRYLERQNIEYIKYTDYDIKNEMPDLVFYQNPYDSTRPPNFHINNIKRYINRVVYIPYGLDVSGGSENIKWQFNMDVQKNAWKIIARSEKHKRFYKKYCENKYENIVALGHPKFDLIYEILNDTYTIPIDWQKKMNNRKVIMWNPHFTVDIGYWSTFIKWKEDIFKLFSNNDKVVLLMRPHPLLFERLKKLNIYTEEEIRELRDYIKDCKNVILDEYDDYRYAFRASDALISDAGSFLLEYLPTEKPILYLPNNDGPGLYDDSIIDGYYLGEKHDDIKSFIDMVSKNKDYFKLERISNINNNIPYFDGKIGQRIMEYLLKELEREQRYE